MSLEPMKHHPDGPSNYPAWSGCADYEGHKDEAIAAAPDAKKLDQTASSRGTAQHTALAMALTGQPGAFAGLSETEEEEVRWVAAGVIAEATANGYAPEEIRVEQRLTLLKRDSFDVEFFGTADVEYGPFLEDAKFGDPHNYFAQLAGYALAKMDKDGLDTVFAKIRYGRWKKVVSHTITRETAETVVYSLLRKRRDPNRQPTVCEYCGWCAKKSTCSALVGVVNTLLSKRLDWAITLPTMSTKEAGTDPALLGAMRWIWKTWIEEWGAAVEYSTNVSTAFGTVPLGFRKQNEKGRLSIPDTGKAVAALVAAGVPSETILAGATLALGSLGKAYKAAFGGSEDKAQARIEAILVEAGAAARGEPSFKLIRNKDGEDDIRAALARPVVPAPEAIK